MVTRVLLALYLATLALMPWSWFPPFPWLHAHAQWRDAVFAATAVVWVVERFQARQWPRLGPLHVAMAAYLGAATLSLSLASPDKQVGALKLVGLAELCVLAVITADLAARPRVPRLIAWAIAVTSLLTAAAAVAGMVLFYAGVQTQLIGGYGDLVYSPWYSRAQAGTYHPNLLASFCIFASSVVALRQANLPSGLRRVTQALIFLTVLLTFSRGILAFGLAAAVRAARTESQRKLVGLYAAACVMIITSLTVWNLSFNPARPFDTRPDTVPSSRWQTINTSLRTLVAHPLVGSGVGASPGFYRGMSFDAHLTPLNVAATMGLPALIAFSAIFIILWRERSRPTDLPVWGCLAGLGLDALAQDIEDFHHLWVMIGLASCLLRESPKEKLGPDQYRPT
jgi:hypothetical protein